MTIESGFSGRTVIKKVAEQSGQVQKKSVKKLMEGKLPGRTASRAQAKVLRLPTNPNQWVEALKKWDRKDQRSLRSAIDKALETSA